MVIPALLQWLVTGAGPLSSNIAEAAAFLRSADFKSSNTLKENQPLDYGSGGVGPDFEIIVGPIAYNHQGEKRPQDNCNIFSITAAVLRLQSSGTITLNSTDPFDKPIIDPKYLSDKEDNDRKVLMAGLRLIMKIVRSDAMKKYLEPCAYQ